MAHTQRFNILKARLRELRKRMLPSIFSPTGNYSDRQKDHARGYRLLAHAEIESYVEDAAREVIFKALRDWTLTQKPSKTIVAFMSCYHSSWRPDDTNAQDEVLRLARNRKCIADNAKEILDAASNQYIEQLKNNHGIRTKNLQRILVPAGIDLTTLDQTWLTNIDTFGELRGRVAHNSAARVTESIDPKTEYDRVKGLLEGLKNLDEMLEGLMN
jgi:hypothetical protein